MKIIKKTKKNINKRKTKRKINLLLDDTVLLENGHGYVVNEVLTNELVEFVFETLGDELHYLYYKPIEEYDEYDVSNFVNVLRKHCKIPLILNGGVI